MLLDLCLSSNVYYAYLILPVGGSEGGRVGGKGGHGGKGTRKGRERMCSFVLSCVNAFSAIRQAQVCHI